MASTQSPPAQEILKLLEPALVRGLERHLSAATEWFPHEYVPYEVGRNYRDEPWELADSDLDAVSRVALEVNLLTEDNLPSYHRLIHGMFGKGDGAWINWVGRWTAEGFLAIALHRDDVVLPGDLALRKAIQRAYGLDHLPTQPAVVAIAEAWRPYRSLAVNYLFASAYGG